MHDKTKDCIDRDFSRIKDYLAESEELRAMCKNCEAYCGEEHDYNECLDKPCFTFYRCYEYLDFDLTWR